MAEKTLEQLTLIELRRECAVREFSATGSNAELALRLAEQLGSSGTDPDMVRFTRSKGFVTTWSGDDKEHRESVHNEGDEIEVQSLSLLVDIQDLQSNLIGNNFTSNPTTTDPSNYLHQHLRVPTDHHNLEC